MSLEYSLLFSILEDFEKDWHSKVPSASLLPATTLVQNIISHLKLYFSLKCLPLPLLNFYYSSPIEQSEESFKTLTLFKMSLYLKLFNDFPLHLEYNADIFIMVQEALYGPVPAQVSNLVLCHCSTQLLFSIKLVYLNRHIFWFEQIYFNFVGVIKRKMAHHLYHQTK